MAISHKPGTVFNSPETQQWLSTGSPLVQSRFHFFGTEFLTHFLSYKHQSIIYSHLTAQPVSGLSRTAQKSPKFLQFRSHVLGPIKWPIPGLFHIKHAFYCTISTQAAHSFSGQSRPLQKSQTNSNNSVPCFGTDQQPIPGIFHTNS